MEPINLFSRFNDRARIARRFRELGETKLEGTDDGWTRAAVICEEGKLTLLYDPELHVAAHWASQLKEMSEYYARLPETPRKAQAVALPATFTLSLAAEFLPDCDPDGDSRLELLFQLARELDAVIFTPSALRDACGRILYDGDEEDEDPDAVWPAAD